MDIKVEALELSNRRWYAVVSREDVALYETKTYKLKKEALEDAKYWARTVAQSWDALINRATNDGTLARLTGLKEDDNLDKVRVAWIEWAMEYAKPTWTSSVEECWESFTNSPSYEPIYEVGMFVEWQHVMGDTTNGVAIAALGEIVAIEESSYPYLSNYMVTVRPYPEWQHGYCLCPAVGQDTLIIWDEWIDRVASAPNPHQDQLTISDIKPEATKEVIMTATTAATDIDTASRKELEAIAREIGKGANGKYIVRFVGRTTEQLRADIKAYRAGSEAVEPPVVEVKVEVEVEAIATEVKAEVEEIPAPQLEAVKPEAIATEVEPRPAVEATKPPRKAPAKAIAAAKAAAAAAVKREVAVYIEGNTVGFSTFSADKVWAMKMTKKQVASLRARLDGDVLELTAVEIESLYAKRLVA